ncbi:isocitrate lyase/phosphoenolpyruvate mutase family protein [Arsenicitalea aurantiaca]|uniref:Isocitrate lyase/phosphoenolpyruvate mutase family protein n=2 Tax=Arsenicitalea aurantiaca TaxID=1783274 RepID=A0A433XMJ1_9HYPH|nr:isocitrate lyase/phosphoenolpyruvate mutase family protein [Arsenicitalea aurantiaca]
MQMSERRAGVVLRFAALHAEGIFVLANAWNAGSARMLERLGARAIGTTSAGLAWGLAREDGAGQVLRVEALENARQIMAATTLPVSADLENGYGPDPRDCADTIRAAMAMGLAGGSIEDGTGLGDGSVYPFQHALERIHACVEVIRAARSPFILTARAEGLLADGRNLEAVTARLAAFARAGADVVRRIEDIAMVAGAVGRPLSVLVEAGRPGVELDALERAEVRRVSLGRGLFDVGIEAAEQAARQALAAGVFGYGGDCIGVADTMRRA